MKPRKILIADDSLIVLKTLSNQLRSHGLQVLTADNGREAVRLARAEQPDLIPHRSLAVGAVAFLHKPIDNAALIQIIRQTLGDTEQEACLSV